MLVLGLGLTASLAAADSITPVRLAITIASTGHVGASLPIAVTVSADPGVLDGSEGPLRIEVKLAGECGGDFATTPGTTLLDAQLDPQPTTGKAYAATARGSGLPDATGTQTVCTFLEDADVGRVYANDESDQVQVGPAVPSGGGGSTTGGGGSTSGSGGSRSGTGGSRSVTGKQEPSRRCTAAVHGYDADVTAVSRAERRLRHATSRTARRRLQRTIATGKRTEKLDRAHARAVCGSAVRL